MSQYRIIRYALSPQTSILMYDHQESNPIEILFEDYVTLSDGRSKPARVLLQLTSESLIIRSIVLLPRDVTIKRDPTTRSFGFSIKGGKDTGFPVLISRISDNNSHLLHIGDVILTINHGDISELTHDQVITRLRDLSDDQVNLTIQYMTDIATYLHLTAPRFRSSVALTLSRISSGQIRRNGNHSSAEYLSEYRLHDKQKRLSLRITDQHEVTKFNKDSSIDYNHIQEYPLLYAYVSQYLNGTDKLRLNSFQLHTFDGNQTGLIITNTTIQQNMWISRINMVIHRLTTRKLRELNQTFLSSEQVFYANWIHERIINLNQNHLPKWQAIFLVFKGADLYLFDENPIPPLCASDFICCKRVYSIIEIFIETVSLKYCIDDRRYCFTLTLPNNFFTECRYLNFERKNEYDDFISNYQRALYITVYSIQTRIFGCLYQGQICRLIIDINQGFEMYHNKTNLILWTFAFKQLQSSSDNDRDKIYFQFKDHLNDRIIDIEVHCQQLRILIHVINAFLTVKFIGQQDN